MKIGCPISHLIVKKVLAVIVSLHCITERNKIQAENLNKTKIKSAVYFMDQTWHFLAEFMS